MAVPKRKTSKIRRDKRRTHDALIAPSFSTCQKCGEATRSHHICDNCGTYNRKQILEDKG
ncbi:MAG: 50S ribosomal protein L32 [Candidatus Cloacimonetes bacterium]|jgi:large subunit ribosomal protein L32|nr:50S ribosomal protein L32 [Candidatus Cloacimonadota bacterium]MDD2506246.1 50S ribosomal protein L32 [Candidatus Cloacimonadota bacterium]MDD4147349.1 50S ribosomal protein L32 [Candidatus Cloacimonadota bacterium]MDD4559299.1 50S ribosomal protein L32 [Candidatus Cloacimonadota bacterium]